MDKKSYVSQSQLLNEPSETSSGVTCDDGAAELPQNINQMDFQTMKAANDTAKVCFEFQSIDRINICFIPYSMAFFVVFFFYRRVPKFSSVNPIY